MRKYSTFIVIILVAVLIPTDAILSFLDSYGQEVIIVGAILLPLILLVAIALKASNKF